MKKIDWENSIWFFDIDDTLIDTAGTSLIASEGIRDVFVKYYNIEIAQRVQNDFNELFSILMQGHSVKNEEDWKKIGCSKEEYFKNLEDIASRQISVKEDFGTIKKWSREVFIKIISDRIGIKVSPQIVKEAGNAFWDELTKCVPLFPNALTLIKKIKETKRPLFLLTGSDGRLEMCEDGQFVYSPEHSEMFKRERIETLRSKGLDFDNLSIGDPEDKPHFDFFEKGLKAAESFLEQKIDARHCIMVGDSFSADLETPLKMGFGLGVLYNKDINKLIVGDNFFETNNLADLLTL